MKLKSKLIRVRNIYFLMILIVDLNSCKEIVENIENHHYHDDEEEVSSPSSLESGILAKRKRENSESA